MQALYRSGAVFLALGVALAGCSPPGKGGKEGGSAAPVPTVGPNEVVIEVPEMT